MVSHRIKLRGRLVKTASSAYIGDTGELCVEIFDFSDEAQKVFGNDVAYTVSIHDKAALRQLLGLHADAKDVDIVDRVATQFEDYYAVKRWLEASGVAFDETFESWA